ncbi:MAG: hypothetical protein NTZ74_05460 [Chloroflexi bacterium]|nr:hypothetical protein [Chloroflexota bacterium]
MPSLKKMLRSYAPDLIDRISLFWGVDSINQDYTVRVNLLVDAMLNIELRNEILESLTPSALEAWKDLVQNENKETWTNFSRKYGDIRQFGPSKREREAPENHPTSTSEYLWYRGLIGRAFFNLPPEPREFVYVPDELIGPSKISAQNPHLNPIRPVSKTEIQDVLSFEDRILDHMTDWLSAKRMGRILPESVFEQWGITESFLSLIAKETGLIDPDNNPNTEKIKTFVQTGHEELMRNLFSIWKSSRAINELRMLPGILCEGTWENDPIRPREVIIEVLKTLKFKTWYSLSSMVNTIKIMDPDFQRPSGDFDSWFIRQTDTNDYLRGFDHWDDVEGVMITHLLTGPFFWMNRIDLAVETKTSKIHAFRLNPRFYSSKMDPLVEQNQHPKLRVTSDLHISLPTSSPLILRYQIGRFCELSDARNEETLYYLTPASLTAAQEQGLKPGQMIQLLEKFASPTLLINLKSVVERWEKNGLESRIEKLTILRLSNTHSLQVLQNNPKTSIYIVEILNTNTALIDIDGVKIISKTLLNEGILTQIDSAL